MNLILLNTLASSVRQIITICVLSIALFGSAACDARESNRVSEAGGTKSFVLENGMRVVVVPDHRAPVVAHMVWFGLGAADEPPGKSGIAHFLEHLMFKGTAQVSPGEFSKIIARNGGRDNAFTSQDYTGYFQTVAADRLELVMELEADRMVNLSLTEDVVLPERNVVLEERRSRVDNDPRAVFNEQFVAAQYLAHPYGIPIIGWEHEIAQLTLEDALRFYKAYYAPNNAILVVVGDVTVDHVRTLAKKHYGPLKSRARPTRVKIEEPPQMAARSVTMSDHRVRQPTWSRTYIAPSYTSGNSELAPALDVLADVIGGGSTSRLYRRLVVEKKVAADVGAWYQGSSRDLTRLGLYGVSSPGGDIEAVEAGVDEVLRTVLTEGLKIEEVERAKRNLVAQAIYARDSLLAKAQLYGESLAIGLSVEDVEAWPDKIREITVDEVNAAAREVLQERSSVSGYLLPKTDEESGGSGS